ncbi:hypothetical protein FPHOBKDP_00084 [Listeria phage LPJP1]|nr:hypothetical protein FPHOBKDP_00084 [Listeria phage LPJP1]
MMFVNDFYEYIYQEHIITYNKIIEIYNNKNYDNDITK